LVGIGTLPRVEANEAGDGHGSFLDQSSFDSGMMFDSVLPKDIDAYSLQPGLCGGPPERVSFKTPMNHQGMKDERIKNGRSEKGRMNMGNSEWQQQMKSDYYGNNKNQKSSVEKKLGEEIGMVNAKRDTRDGFLDELGDDLSSIRRMNFKDSDSQAAEKPIKFTVGDLRGSNKKTRNKEVFKNQNLAILDQNSDNKNFNSNDPSQALNKESLERLPKYLRADVAGQQLDASFSNRPDPILNFGEPQRNLQEKRMVNSRSQRPQRQSPIGENRNLMDIDNPRGAIETEARRIGANRPLADDNTSVQKSETSDRSKNLNFDQLGMRQITNKDSRHKEQNRNHMRHLDYIDDERDDPEFFGHDMCLAKADGLANKMVDGNLSFQKSDAAESGKILNFHTAGMKISHRQSKRKNRDQADPGSCALVTSGDFGGRVGESQGDKYRKENLMADGGGLGVEMSVVSQSENRVNFEGINWNLMLKNSGKKQKPGIRGRDVPEAAGNFFENNVKQAQLNKNYKSGSKVNQKFVEQENFSVQRSMVSETSGQIDFGAFMGNPKANTRSMRISSKPSDQQLETQAPDAYHKDQAYEIFINNSRNTNLALVSAKNRHMTDENLSIQQSITSKREETLIFERLGGQRVSANTKKTKITTDHPVTRNWGPSNRKD
jgi:hypothetical protein